MGIFPEVPQCLKANNATFWCNYQWKHRQTWIHLFWVTGNVSSFFCGHQLGFNFHYSVMFVPLSGFVCDSLSVSHFLTLTSHYTLSFSLSATVSDTLRPWLWRFHLHGQNQSLCVIQWLRRTFPEHPLMLLLCHVAEKNLFFSFFAHSLWLLMSLLVF